MTTWTVPRVWVSGERVSAVKMNEISTDLEALYPSPISAWQLLHSDGSKPAYSSLATIAANAALVSGQSAWNFIVALNASALTTIASGVQNSFLNGGGPPAFRSIVYARRGGSATIWATGGANTYTPSNSLFLAGASDVTVSSGSGSATISFPSTFDYAPIVHIGLYCSSSRRLIHRISAVSTTGFDITINDLDGLSSTVTVFWLAIGDQ